MIYENKSHIKNNHPKHSQLHAYSFAGEYLGHKDDLELITGWDFDKFLSEGKQVIYDSETCTYTISSPNEALKVYEVVLTQNLVILGYRKIV